jgi:hypothetical protein
VKAFGDGIGSKRQSVPSSLLLAELLAQNLSHCHQGACHCQCFMCRCEHRGRGAVKVPTTYAGAANFVAWAGQSQHFPFDDDIDCVYALIVIMESLCNLLVLAPCISINSVAYQQCHHTPRKSEAKE